jgi:hypothetical protein
MPPPFPAVGAPSLSPHSEPVVQSFDDLCLDDGGDDDGSTGSSDFGSDVLLGDEERGAAQLEKDRQEELIKKQQEEIAKAETRSVRSLRAMLLVVLILSAVGVALAVYFYTSTSEQAQFESGYQGDVNKVFEGIGRSIENTLASLDSFMVSIVSEAQAAGEKWPFVTIPHFAVRATKMRLQSSGYALSVVPLVRREQRREWEAYALNNSGWFNDTMNAQENNEYYYGPISYNYSVSPVIYGYAPYITEPPLFLPTWQTDPST